MYEVSIYPDTGHHYYFYPIMLDTNPTNLKFSNEVKNKLERYLPIKYNNQISKELNELADKPYHSWFDGAKSFEYMRCHVESRNIVIESHHLTVLGLNICIESNLGTEKDGLFPNSIETATSEQVNNRLDNYAIVYIERTKEELANRVEEGNFSLNLKEVFPTLFNSIEKNSSEEINLEMNIDWKQGAVEREPIPVNLVIDYGNSRTVAFAMDMENAGQNQENLKDKCKPIYLNDSFYNAQEIDLFKEEKLKYDLEDVIVDSWFTLISPKFSPLQVSSIKNIKKNVKKHKFDFFNSGIEMVSIATDREAYMFSELSPAELGKNAYKAATSVPMDQVVRNSLSSPKRYMWDMEKQYIVKFWDMVDIDSDTGTVITKDLEGRYLGFIHPDWEDSEFSEKEYCEIADERLLTRNPANFKLGERNTLYGKLADFPTSDAMIMNALSILEKANRQIMSERYRYRQDRNRRYIKKISITYPCGWTDEEYWKYEDAWHKAKNIFLWSQYTEDRLNSLSMDNEESEYCPSAFEVNMGMNEAVSSALPIVFSEVNHFGYKVDEWISSFAQKGRNNSVRVLTMDIGGGTQDISIIDYINTSNKDAINAKIRLSYNTIFSDSSRNAGDILIKRLLEEVFFPYMTKDLNDDELYAFEDALKGFNDNIADTNLRAMVNRTVLMPIVVDWLKKCNIDTSYHESGVTDTRINQCGVSFEHLKVFNSWFDGLNVVKLKENDMISVNYADIYKCIESWIKESILDPILLFEGFECDLLIVSGKPSELSIVQKIIKLYFPITSNEIIFVKNYYAGDWLPYTDNSGRIKDAKLVTVIGGLLSQSIYMDIFSNWLSLEALDSQNDTNQRAKYFWSVYGDHHADLDILLNPEEDEKTIFVDSSMQIGRFLFKGGNVQKIYDLNFFNDNNSIEDLIEITLKRTESDQLEISNISGIYKDGTKVDSEDWELMVNTLENSKYWLDDPQFTINNFRG